ncbi:hypothetical protein [Muriicola sp. Z0-33]|uniref:hypothetical protein n=1 Tax=Muriicola sp. Z0-33 TaxID=2816957 RepID=UPI0022388438|nr:hypothetical protein [Muriicola sp. Z0-33]MCW5515183.1 hypothetical protein [Muriicola sp. Z0-33]
MTDNVSVKPPMWFWIVSAVALVWNIMGVMAYLGSAFITEEMKAEMPSDQLALMENTPAWVTAAFAIAVWGGFLGCIALLLRKKWARPVLLISLIGIIVQMSYSFFMTNASEVYGQVQGVIMPILLIVIGAALVLLAKTATNKNWLR